MKLITQSFWEINTFEYFNDRHTLVALLSNRQDGEEDHANYSQQETQRQIKVNKYDLTLYLKVGGFWFKYDQ